MTSSLFLHARKALPGKKLASPHIESPPPSSLRARSTPVNPALAYEIGPPERPRRRGLTLCSIVLTTSVSAALVVGVGMPAHAADTTPTATTPSFTPDRTVVSDSLNQTDTAGWADASVGGSYGLTDSSAFSESAQGGTISLPASGTANTATLPATSSTDTGGSFSVKFPQLPAAGRGVSAGIQFRQSSNNYYQASIRVAPGGVATLALDRINGSSTNQTNLGTFELPFAVSANTPVSVEFQVVKDAPVIVSARAWLTGSSVPDWQLTESDSSADRVSAGGNIALWSYVSRTTAPVSVVFESVAASALIPSGSAADPVSPAPTTDPTAPAAPTPTQPAPTATPTAVPTATPTDPTPADPTPADPTPADPTPSAPVVPSGPGGARANAGAAAVGSTHYAIPDGAVFVSPSGSANGTGSMDAPYQTLAQAVTQSPAGSTIVLRAGTYHESVIIYKQFTIQSYPGEAVWLDGSSVVGNWVQHGSTWVASGWNTSFDSSPTYTRGSGDSGGSNWQFVNPAYPLAAHPDQVWVGDTAQRQVASASQVTAGTFAVDYNANTITIGTDPGSATVRASDLVKALSIRSAGTVVRGIGIAHYAPSVPDMGAVTAERPYITLENVAITDSATTGLYVIGAHNTLRNVTAVRSGLMGVGAANADNLTVTGLLASDNNTEHFNNAPASGGMKLTRMLAVSISNSVFADNAGPGLWFDESVGGITVVGSDILNNAGHGLVTELSANVLIANNIVAGNRDNGMKINDTSNVSIWNNTLTGNGRSINIVEDYRRASNLSTPGHDPRNPSNPLFTWVNGPATVNNNIIADTTSGANCLLCVEDYSHQSSAAQWNVNAQNNVYQRASSQSPSWDVIWANGAANPQIFSTVAAFHQATGQESSGTDIVGSPALTSGWVPVGAAAAAAGSAVGIPNEVAAATGISAGSKNIGAWLN